MVKKIISLCLSMLVLASVLTTPLLAAAEDLEKAGGYIQLSPPNATEGMLMTALIMSGAAQPLDAISTNYILEVDNAVSQGVNIYEPDAIIGLSAAGMNASNVQNGKLLADLAQDCLTTNNPDLLADTLLALASGGYSFPSGSISVETMLARLMSTQKGNGSFGLEDQGNMLTTAKALTSLAYYKKYDGVQQAVANGGGFMVQNQTETSVFPSDTGNNVASTAACITALSLNGHDTSVLEGKNAIKYLLSAQNSNGGFGSHIGASSDEENSILGTIALYSHTVINTSIFDFSDNLATTLPQPVVTTEPEVEPTPEQTPEPTTEETTEETSEKLEVSTVFMVLGFCVVIGASIPIIIIKVIKRNT